MKDYDIDEISDLYSINSFYFKDKEIVIDNKNIWEEWNGKFAHNSNDITYLVQNDINNYYKAYYAIDNYYELNIKKEGEYDEK